MLLRLVRVPDLDGLGGREEPVLTTREAKEPTPKRLPDREHKSGTKLH